MTAKSEQRLKQFFAVSAVLTVAALAIASLLAWTQRSDAQFSSGGSVTQAQLTAALAAVVAQMPQPASTVPPQPSGTGIVGSGLNYIPSNAAQRQTVQRTTVLTDASGNWSVTWSTPFVSSIPTVNPLPLNPTGTVPYNCNVLTRSSTGATGKCWQLTSQTVALISLTISLAPSTAPSNVSVMLIGAEPTQ